MRHLFNIITALMLAFCLCVTSCSKEEDVGTTGQTTSIALNIPMLEATTKVPVNGDENAINNLRIIILSQSAESINRTFTKTELDNSGGTIIIDNVPVGLIQMYAIANEASLGKDYDNLSNLQNDVVDAGNNTRKVLIKDESRIHFPKRGSEFPESGLPMSWMNKSLTINPPTGAPQTVRVTLERSVAKMKIIMQSTLSEDITINEINFGEFFGDMLYLFREESLDIPDNTTYSGKTFDGLNITIPKNGENSLVCYIYPSYAWKSSTAPSPYTIGFKTEAGITYDPQPFVNDHGALNSIVRNTQINISAKLSKPANINLKFEVTDWNEVTVDVPPFN